MREEFIIKKINFPIIKSFDMGKEQDDGAIAQSQKANLITFGFGTIIVENGESRGISTDILGNSIITNFNISDNKLEFKQQQYGEPEISYRFTHKENGVWIGLYFGDKTKGKCNCLITQKKLSAH